MLDLGIIGRGKAEDYETKFLNDLSPEMEISGEIIIGEIKQSEIGGPDAYEFYVTIIDQEYMRRWSCKINASYYPETGNIYGKKEGRVYIFIDSLNHVVNNTQRNLQDSYSVNFNTFRGTVNNNINQVTVKAIRSLNPNAKYVNLEIIKAEYATEKEQNSNIEDMINKNPVIRMGYENLKDKNEEITVKSIAFELKNILSKGDITNTEYMDALKELDKIK